MYRNPEEEHECHSGVTGDERDHGGESGKDHEGRAHTVQRTEHGSKITPIAHQAVPQCAAMRRVLLVMVSAALLVSCAGGSANPGTPTVTSPETTTISTVEPPEPTTSTSMVVPGPPVAWLAPNGVPMPVLTVIEGGVETMTSCGETVEMREGDPIYSVDVVLDPGHGGPVDTGAIGFNRLPEKEINLKVALATAALLESRGITVMLTRIGDYPLPIPVRTDYADLVGAKAVISIHHNAPEAPASEIPGVEIFVQKDSADSQRLGGLVYDHTMVALSGFDVDWDRATDAGVMTVINSDGEDAYGMVRRPVIPAILAELGYIANDAEALLYRQPDYVPLVSTALADAVETYLSGDDPGAPLVEGRIFDPRPGVGFDQCVAVDLVNPLYPNVVEADVTGTGTYDFTIGIDAPYETADRYMSGVRIIGDDGVVYADDDVDFEEGRSQPILVSVPGVVIPATVTGVRVEARDLVYGWGGSIVTVALP